MSIGTARPLPLLTEADLRRVVREEVEWTATDHFWACVAGALVGDVERRLWEENSIKLIEELPFVREVGRGR